MKKFLVCILVLSLSFASVAFGASIIKNSYFNENLKLVVNGNPVDIRIVTVELEGEQYGRNYYSIADLVKALNDYGGISAKVDFDSSTKTTIIEIEQSSTQEKTTSETIKQSISTPIVPTTKTPTPIPSQQPKEEKTVNEPYPQNDGSNTPFTYNGIQYIFIHNPPNSPDLLPDNYRFERDVVNGKLSDIITFKNKNSETNKWETLIENVPYKNMGYFCIQYDYYQNTILPLIKD